MYQFPNLWYDIIKFLTERAETESDQYIYLMKTIFGMPKFRKMLKPEAFT